MKRMLAAGAILLVFVANASGATSGQIRLDNQKLVVPAFVPGSHVPDKPQPANYSTPVCNCMDQCDAMWAQAVRDIESFSGMRIRVASDTIVETYTSTNASRMTGTVHKVPLSGGKYQIQVDLEPWSPNMSGLGDAIQDAVNRMNQRMNYLATSASCKTTDVND